LGYHGQMGIPLTLFHPVRDINEAYVAGQAAAVTKALLGPDRLAATGAELAAVVLSDFATGWVKVVCTLPRFGEYTLTLTNPSAPTADGRVTDYPIFFSAGVSASGNLLTSLDRVRTRMQLKNAAGLPITPSDPHVFDDLINLLISEVSDEYQKWFGRNIAEADYIEYLDGSGRSSLLLGAGPLVSFTSLESVEYEDNGAGGVTETRTIVQRHTFVLAGLVSQPRYTGLGRIDLLGISVFNRGPKRYRVVYRAGFATIPEAIVGLATADVVYRLMTKDTGHLLSQSLGDGTITFMRPQQMQESRVNVLGMYQLEAA